MTMRRFLMGLGLSVSLGMAVAPPVLAQDEPPSWVVEIPNAEQTHEHKGMMAVILSGDGGWADLDKDLAERLRTRGVPVVGVDSLKYFWTQRSPEETATALGKVIDTYREQWKRDQVLLIGFSFGAAILPAVVNRLPEDTRKSIVLGAMLTSNLWANWEIHVGDWLKDTPGKEATDVVPEAQAVKGLPLLCIYGVEEKDQSACPKIEGQAKVIALPGGHHFDEDYDKLADLVLAEVKARP